MYFDLPYFAFVLFRTAHGPPRETTSKTHIRRLRLYPSVLSYIIKRIEEEHKSHDHKPGSLEHNNRHPRQLLGVFIKQNAHLCTLNPLHNTNEPIPLISHRVSHHEAWWHFPCTLMERKRSLFLFPSPCHAFTPKRTSSVPLICIVHLESWIYCRAPLTKKSFVFSVHS